MLSLSDSLEAEATSPRSQTSSAYESIRNDILSGRHLPGKKLKIQDLASQLGVSPGAVREALSRLVPEQLVVSRDQRGFVVAPLSIADLQDLTDLRCEIEAIALRRSVERGDLNWEVALIGAAHRLRGLPATINNPDPEINPDWIASHAAYHTALVSACGSRRLLALHAQLYEQSERYRGLSFYSRDASDYESTRNVEGEHQQIVDLALARDVDGVIRATIEHIRQTTVLIIEAARNQMAENA